MNDTVSFKSNGLIDPLCITTIGVSVKESENPIGFFGTGLKYAIAIILRSGGEVTVWRGKEPLKFASAERVIRGKPVQIVTMNGHEIGFTTDLGKHWKMWQAFREIYCNTVDEGGKATFGMEEPTDDTTTVHVCLQEFAECFANIDQYILLTTPIYNGPLVAFHPGPTSAIFYRSIRVGERVVNKPFKFAPNLVARVDLTEDRTLKDQWTAHYHIAQAILKCEDEAFLGRWLSASDEYAEHHIDVDYPSVEPSSAFLKVAMDLAGDLSRPCNITVSKVLARHKTPPSPVPAILLPTEKSALQEAVKFCHALGYAVDEFPVVVVESLGKHILGVANMEQRRILIARRAISMGHMQLASTLIEEWAHIKHEYEDCSREMQNWLFEQVTRLGEAYLDESRRRAAA